MTSVKFRPVASLTGCLTRLSGRTLLFVIAALLVLLAALLPSFKSDAASLNNTYFTFTGANGDEVTFPPDFQPPNATLSSISRGPGINPIDNAGTFSARDWSVAPAALDLNDYYTFTITPNSGYRMTLTSIVLDERRSPGGIRNWFVRSSLDGYTSDLATFSVPDDALTRTNQTITLGAAFTNLSSGVEFRIYGYNSEGPAGTWRVDNIKINGSIVPTLTIDSVTQVEGTGGTSNLVYTVTMGGTTTDTVTVNYATSNSTAIAGSDYTATSGMLTFAANTTTLTQTITVPLNPDCDVELNEDFTMTLSSASNAFITTATGTGTITNDDANVAGTIAFSSATYSVNENGVTATITVNRTGGTAPTTVSYATSDGTATAGSDYTMASGMLSFACAETSKTFTVSITDDGDDEPNETINLTLSNPTNGATLGTPSTAVLTIEDNDIPELSIDSVILPEGDTGTTSFVFKVTLSQPSLQVVSVNYATGDVTATAGSDYVADSNSISFGIGETEKTIAITVNGDCVIETDERFSVTLSNPTNAVIAAGGGTGTGTIRNDDFAGTITFSSATYSVNENGTTATITVNRTGGAAESVTVDYATSNGTATAGSDYDATSGTLTFACAETSKTFTIPITNDSDDELSETINLTLSNPTNGAMLGTPSTAVLTIADDDFPTVSIDDVTLPEGTGSNTTFTFTVSLSSLPLETASVDYTIAGVTATSGTDFTAVPLTGTITFNPAEMLTQKQITVTVIGDCVVEPDETFTITLSNPVNAVLSTTDNVGTGTIRNDDVAGTIAFSSATYSVNESGTTATITVNRTGGAAETSVQYATSNGTAVAGSDYTTASGTLNFACNETSKTFTVAISNDGDDELNETINLTLSNPTDGATLGTPSAAVLTIVDDDVPMLSISNVSVVEGTGGTTNAVFSVSISIAPAQTVTVDFATADGTAQAPSDYATTSNTLTFPAGSTTAQTITIPIVTDCQIEGNQRFFVNLSNATGGAAIDDDQGVGTITNDDLPGTIAIEQSAYTTDEATAVVVKFIRTGGTGASVAVSYAITPNTATQTTDYNSAAFSGSVTFGCGETMKSVTITPVDDNINEPNETLNVTISNPTNGATLGTAAATVTITDNDPVPTVSVNNVSVTEGNSGTVDLVFTVSLSNPSTQTFSYNYQTMDGTATSTDYQSTSGSLIFNPLETEKQVTVKVIGDLLDEANETLLLKVLEGATEVAQGTGRILDDDEPPTISINDAIVTEGNSGTVNLSFTISLSAPSGRTVRVTYATADNTATVPGDYNAVAGTQISFAPGETSKVVTVAVKGDLILEPTETLFVNLSNPSNATINDGQGIGTILDNDLLAAELSVQAADPIVCNGPGSTVTVTATVTNPNTAAEPVKFTATLPAQLLALSGTCSADTGTCSVMSASNVMWTGTLQANQTVTITYLAQIADNAVLNAKLCINSETVLAEIAETDVEACVTANCPTDDPGTPTPATTAVSDQKPGSVLIYPVYTSSLSNPGTENTRLTITNTDTRRSANVHFFFVDGNTCSVADNYLCLTPNQTTSFLASDLDPGVTGYVVAVATDEHGCPVNFNKLIGGEYIKFATGHAANLSAEAVAAIAGGLPLCNPGAATATLAFDGTSYNPLPRVLALSNIASPADGNSTMLILNHINGNLLTQADSIGSLFGVLFDDQENPYSFAASGNCQLRAILSNNFPRTSPRLGTVIPANHSGWMKLWTIEDRALLGAAINHNTTGGFRQGHNLHKLTFTTKAKLTIPVFAPNCR